LITIFVLLGLALLGGGIGLLVSGFGARSLMKMVSESGRQSFLDVGLDLRLVLFTVVVCLATVVLFALAPALSATGNNFESAVRQRGLSNDRPSFRSLGSWLVVTQVGLCLMLLIGAGLFLRSLVNLRNIDPGVDASAVLFAGIDPAGGGLEGDELVPLYKRLLQAAEEIPEVDSASLSTYGLFTGFGWRNQAFAEGLEAERERLSVNADITGGKHFETLGIPLLRGRRFTEDDRGGSPGVAIVSLSFAKHFFGADDPIGKRFGLGERENSRDLEIVGVVADAKYQSLREENTPMVYRPLEQLPDYLEALSVRTNADPAQLANRLRDVLTAVDPRLPVLDLRTLDAQIDRSLNRHRLVVRLSTFFGALALVMAALGLYALLAYSVSRRRREIGLRIAIGARPVEIVVMIMRDAGRLVGVGALLGLPAALALGRFASSMLFDLEPMDPITLVGATLTLGIASVISSYLPARRASRVDPVRSLRCE